MSKYTPGPWSHRNGRIFQTDHETLTIAHVARANDGDYSLTNGQLIAAAPELLEALEDLLDNVPALWECAERAREAIAKATGESHE